MEREKPELNKLDHIDRKLIAWLASNDPDAIESWVKQAVKEYRHKKKVEIDPDALMREIGVSKTQGYYHQR